MRVAQRRAWGLLAVGVALVATACGGSSDDTTDSAASATAAAAPAASEAATTADAATTAAATDNPTVDTNATVPGAKSFKIAVSVYSLNDTYGKALLQGVKDQAEKLGSKVTVEADGQFNPQKQGKDIQDIIALKPDAILLAAGDSAQSRAWVDSATKAGIPTFGLYNLIDHTGPPLYKGVIGATQINEIQAGEAAGTIAGQVVAPGATVGVVLGKAGYAEVPDRLKGFEQAIAKVGEYKVVTSQNGEWTPQHGQSACQELISANPDIKLIYNQSDSMTAGCVRANNLGDVKVVGNGGSTEGLTLIEKGAALGTTCYGPTEMGHETMQLAYNYLTGANTETGILILHPPLPITKDNLDQCPKEW
jgi:ribose transport system substrate-binding protein